MYGGGNVGLMGILAKEMEVCVGGKGGVRKEGVGGGEKRGGGGEKRGGGRWEWGCGVGLIGVF